MRRPSRRRGLTELPATELAALLAQGTLRAQEVTEAQLERIAECEPAVGAWAQLDPDYALAQARALDRQRASGAPIGPLHGLPIGVKDIVDVAGLPCENGTPLDAGRRPARDAAAVARLREAGAVILGKTVTTELAFMQPAGTRNPHDPGRTPGGSSSGSAAAVAAGMVPLAVGSQTNGSVIRPASYCGVVGFKPSRGLVSRRGVLAQSPTLDCLGGFARSVEDVALLHDALAGFDEADPAMRLAARPRLLEAARSKPPLRPTLALVRTALWPETEADLREGFAELVAELGAAVDEVELPPLFARARELHRLVHLAELATHYGGYYDAGRALLSPALCRAVEEGRRLSARDYLRALDWIEVLNAGLEEIFERYDAILTPAAAGRAPAGLDSTGDPAFCTLWTFCGVPALSLPLLIGREGLPIGVQLVGRRGRDGRLLRSGRWLVETLREEAKPAAPATLEG